MSKEPGQKRTRIKGGAPVYKGTARGPQKAGAHKKDGGCRAMALALLGGALVLSSAVAYGALEIFKAALS